MWQTKRLYFGCCKTKFVRSLWEICFFELVKDINQTVWGTDRDRQRPPSFIPFNTSPSPAGEIPSYHTHTHTHNQPLLSVCASVMNLSHFIDINTQTLYSACSLQFHPIRQMVMRQKGTCARSLMCDKLNPHPPCPDERKVITHWLRVDGEPWGAH